MPVDLVLLRGLWPEVPIRAGDVLPARVLGPGTLALAGVRLAVRLPEGLADGARLRLRVQEAGPQRIVLRVVGEPPGAGATPPAGAAGAVSADPLAAAIRAGLVVALPGGALARLFVDPDGSPAPAAAGGRGPSRVTLRYEAATMGRVDIALEIAPGGVAGTVHAPAGPVADRLRSGAEDLRAALAAATGRPAQVSVRERTETVDLRA